ncbi:MAG: peptidylprolyl isomerase [Candidatus Aminicenantes bacterium]|nr:peptidylprolyl isomerase [Candidatus Aminicenantes bacterium]
MKDLLFFIALAVLLLGLGGVLTAQAANPKVVIKTSKGNITLELFPDKAPLTVKNFLAYVDTNFYDGTIFHRVIKGFMIQGGGLTADFREKASRAPIKNEAGNGLSNARSTISMARTPVVDSATSQFFINTVDNPDLDHQNDTEDGFGYCVFGKVVTGLEVVDAIAQVPRVIKHGMENVPSETITILSIRRLAP